MPLLGAPVITVIPIHFILGGGRRTDASCHFPPLRLVTSYPFKSDNCSAGRDQEVLEFTITTHTSRLLTFQSTCGPIKRAPVVLVGVIPRTIASPNHHV